MWPNPQENVNLVTFTEKILDGKLYFLCNEKAVCLSKPSAFHELKDNKEIRKRPYLRNTFLNTKSDIDTKAYNK